VGFAIPSSTVRRVTNLLKQDRHIDLAHLGVALQPLSPAISTALQLSTKTGLLVADVDEGGAAESAGLRPGGVIVTFDGKAIAGLPDLIRGITVLTS
jgi:serine protease Do